MSLVLWCLALTIALLALRAAAKGITHLPVVKVALLPGLVLALAAKLLACALGGAPLREVRPPWKAGEPLEHEPPRVPIVGRLLLGILPFAAAVTAIIALREVLAPSLVFAETNLPHLAAGPEAPQAVIDGICALARAAGTLVLDPSLRELQVALFLYLALAFLVFTAPALEDWIPLAAVLALCALFMALLDFLGVEARFFSRGWWIRRLYGPMVFESLALLLALSLLSLATFSALRLAVHPRSEDAPKPGTSEKSEKPGKKKSRRKKE
jgi:hypothetical protein